MAPVVRLDKHLGAAYWLVLIALLVGCSSGPPVASRGVSDSSLATPTRDKTIIVGQLSAVKGYGPWDFGQTGGGGASLAEVHTVALVSEDLEGQIAPRLAARLPSFDDGSIALLPDGRMRTTWTLRSDVKWHDGAPFTAEDMRFSWDVSREPELISSITTAGLRQAETLEVVDAELPPCPPASWRATASIARPSPA